MPHPPLQGILETLPHTIIFHTTSEWEIQNIYGGALKELHMTPELFTNRSLKTLLGHADFERLKHEAITLEWLGRSFEVSLSMLQSKEYLITLHDITAYQRVDSQLQQSLEELRSKKEELQAVFDLAANGISILDLNGKFLYANRFFQQMMGYSMEELYHESCISLSSPEYAEPSGHAVQQAIKEGSVQNFRKVCITKSGQRLFASMSLSYIKSRQEIVMITSDITQDMAYREELERQIEEEVEKRTEQHEVLCHQSRLAAMGEMIDSIAHQWRQPLNALHIITQSMRHLFAHEQLTPQMLEDIEKQISEKVRFMSRTIDDFRTFFRQSKTKEAFELSSAINDAIQLIKPQLDESSIQIALNLPNSSLSIEGYANEFRQVMLNLLTNAMTALRAQNGPRHITLTLFDSGNEVTLLVADNGGGIENTILERIFEPYFTTHESGSGIGLYMVKMIVEHHLDGRISASNTLEGALFSLHLPYKGAL